MATPILMPKQGNTVESCFLSAWHVKEGDTVKEGTLVFSYETDKAMFDYVSETEGTVLKLLFKEGEIVDVLTPVCFVGEPGEVVDMPEVAKKETVESKETVIESKVESVDVQPSVSPDGVFASPRAKAKAQKQNIDINTIKGSGPGGRIIDRDIKLENVGTAVKLSVGNQNYTMKPLTNMRKIIGKAMMRSLQNTAQLTHSLSFDATDIFAFRRELKKISEKESLPRITFNDIMIFAVSRVLKDYMDLNAHFIDGELKVFEHVHMGIATDTPRGLMVPTLHNADTLSLVDVSLAAKSLITQCIDGNINPDLLTNASFTISNLGTLDIEHFTPIINPPQTGILGVNTISTKVKTDEHGRYVFYQAMGLSLTYDHQVLDGAGASRFLKALKEYLQDFSKHIAEDPMGLK